MPENNIIFSPENASENYIEKFIDHFIEINSSKINDLARNVYQDFSYVSQLAFKEVVKAELKKSCYSFINNNHNPDYINSYLFSSIYKLIKDIKSENKKNVLVCPGCKFISRIEICQVLGDKVVCNYCSNALVNAKEQWQINFYKAFAEHSRKGYKCPDCNNFIPKTDSDMIVCPYPKCFFAGNIENIKISRHPSIKANLEVSTSFEIQGNQYKSSDAELLVKDDLNYYIKILEICIDNQVAQLTYKSNNSTIMSKTCMYQAYKNMIQLYPIEMVSYLVFLNRNIKMQHKIFQEFVNILEQSIPFNYKQNDKIITINSITDENLCIFDGESEFIGSVNEKHEVHNETEELYVGGRKGSYCKPYYIGKLISIVDNNKSLMENVKDYTFFKITLDDNVPIGTDVIVKHLRIFPHYQMGGMVYLNRIRRAIVDRVYYMIYGRKRELQK